MFGFLVPLVAPFFAFSEENLMRNFFLLFVLGFLVDLVSGWQIGLTNFFLGGEIFAMMLYQRNLRLRIRIKVIFGTIFAVVYFYVTRRIFF